MKAFAIAAFAAFAVAETAAAGTIPPPPPATGPVYEIVVVARTGAPVSDQYEVRAGRSLDAMDDRLNREILAASDEDSEYRIAALFGVDGDDTMLTRAGR